MGNFEGPPPSDIDGPPRYIVLASVAPEAIESTVEYHKALPIFIEPPVMDAELDEQEVPES